MTEHDELILQQLHDCQQIAQTLYDTLDADPADSCRRHAARARTLMAWLSKLETNLLDSPSPES